ATLSRSRAPVAQGIERSPAEAEVACSNHAGRMSARRASPPWARPGGVLFSCALRGGVSRRRYDARLVALDFLACREALPGRDRPLVTDTPDSLTLERNRDQGRAGVYVRRALLAVISLFLVAGRLNVFGQRPSTSSVGVARAKLTVYAPTSVRGGLYYEARFHVQA